jgi:hypothetical protein
MSVLAYTKTMSPWRAKLNFAGAFIVAFFAVIFAVSASWRAWGVPMYADLPYVAHAAGGLEDGSTYVNGVDALDASYARGYRYFEMDFRRTTDGALVCSHDWDRDFGGDKPDFQTFSRVNTTLKHQLCTYTSLVLWFRNHHDAILISDAKEDVTGINIELRRAPRRPVDADRLRPRKRPRAQRRRQVSADPGGLQNA